MELAQAGDEAAYLLLLKRISSIVRHAVKRKVNVSQHADMEDIVQDVLVSVHVVRATYDPSRPFLPWLLSIVHHRTVDKFRKSARVAANETYVGELLETLPAEAANTRAVFFGDYVAGLALLSLRRPSRPKVPMLRQAGRNIGVPARLAIELAG